MHPGLIIGHYDHVRERGEYVRRLLRRRRPPPAVTPRPVEPTVSPAFVALLDDTLIELDSRPRIEQQSTVTGPISPRRILMVVADTFATSAGHIQGRSRRLVYCRPRFAYVSLLREFLGWSYTTIGRRLEIDHTSALHAVRRCNAMRLSDQDYAARYEAAHAALTGSPVEPTVSPAFVAMLDATLNEIAAQPPRERPFEGAPVKARRILNVVSDEFEVAAAHIQGRSRRIEYCRARFAYVALLREFLGWSYTTIGRRLEIDHTSALHAVRRCNALRLAEPDYAARYEAAHAALTGSVESAS